jgi:hypothetical protein
MDPLAEAALQETRRAFFARSAQGLGCAALSALGLQSRALGMQSRALGMPGPPSVDALRPHHAPRAKRAIWIFLAGAPSQIDLFDYKPQLANYYDQDLPESVRAGQRLTTMTSNQKRFPIAPSKYRFSRHDNGGDGLWLSELLPHTGKIAEKIAVVRSMYTEAINHDPAITFITTGRELPGWPSLGSWLSYGLGTENRDLPEFVVMTPSWSGRRDAQALYQRLWGAGVLPSKHAGVALRSQGDPVLFLSNPPEFDRPSRRHLLDALARMNEHRYAEHGDPETRSRIAQYEMAFRMQSSVPELVDLKDESEESLDLYGPDARKSGTFAASCILARRMVERGVRFVQIFHRGWDQHFNIAGDLPNQARDIDQPSAALVLDLERRGLLEDTLVVLCGEFGRTVYSQGALSHENYGRDHHPRCWSMWMAGGGVRGGVVHGETDDFSYNITRDAVHVRDLNQTILHLLGLDGRRLFVKNQGLDVKLVGVEEEPRVVAQLLR